MWACAAVLFFMCGDMPRDNVLDPKNPDSLALRKVMIEAFVNTNNPLGINEYALEALDSLSLLYGDRVMIAEYHRNTADYTDPLHLEKNELMYQHYVALFDHIKGVPDVFINGSGARIQGASDVAYSMFRLEQVLAGEVSENACFLIEPGYSVSGDKLRPEVRLARLGSENAENLLVRALIVSHLNRPLHTRVVQAVAESNIIPVLKHGEQQVVVFPDLAFDRGLLNTLIVYVTDAQSTTIFQCESKAIGAM